MTTLQPAMKLETTISDDVLHVGQLSVHFQRTLRIPDDGKTYPLPPWLGRFPVRLVDDYSDRVPREWREHGGVFLPMYQREAMWISFAAPLPHALQVAVGKVCALTGERYADELVKKPQNYVVAPDQPWLDGICIGKGRIRQFVAMPLGQGYTVEGQVTGEEKHGGLQLRVVPPVAGRFPEYHPARRCYGVPGMPPPAPPAQSFGGYGPEPIAMCPAPAAGGPGPYRERSKRGGRAAGAMGLSAGGRMKQKVYRDRHGIDSWDQERAGRVFVHIVNSELWREITGEQPPASPVTAKEYERHGFPWFDLYDEGAPALGATDTLEAVKSVKELDAEKSSWPLQDDDGVSPGPVKKLLAGVVSMVRDGNW